MPQFEDDNIYIYIDFDHHVIVVLRSTLEIVFLLFFAIKIKNNKKIS